MPELPLLPLPRPSAVTPPKGSGGGTKIRIPPKGRQTDRFGPTFDRLQAVLARANGELELRDDPSALAPERVIVFEIGGTIANFVKALSRIPGLEFMAEYETDFVADEDFAIQDDREGAEGQDRTDKPVPGCFYLALPDMQALRELLSLWERWKNDQPLARGYAPFKHLFSQLRDLRPWGPQDRITQETVDFWREERERHPDRPLRTEIELWYRGSEPRRTQSSTTIRALVTQAGGRILHEAIIPEIAYHGMLADVPSQEIENLSAQRTVRLALADEVMFFRPQSILADPQDVEAAPDSAPGVQAVQPGPLQPIAALLDGMPVQAHALLVNRLMIDDPDSLETLALVSRRVHGTAMASLILHGDRNEGDVSLTRPLYVRPIMIANDLGHEHTVNDRLLIDTIYRAVLRIKGSEAEQAVAPSVFLINLSIGDTRRPFTRLISPLARLLDFLADKYGLLFLASGGNVPGPLEIPGFGTWGAFEGASADERARAVITGLNAAKHERTILSPAESLNAITVGAQHHDNLTVRPGAHTALDPFNDNTLPNISSGMGLGHRRMIKPEVYFPGGREHIRMHSTGTDLNVAVGQPGRMYGLSAAAPDALGQGRLDQVALSAGTSPATALATRAAHRIFDSLMDRDGGSLLWDVDPEFYAVVVKALLVHTARWNGNEELLKEICGPEDKRRHVERAENSSRFIGFGTPTVSHSLECSANRATLVGFGSLQMDTAHSYTIPLPTCLERVTDPRRVTVTVAWFSPIKPGHQSYRCARLEAASVRPPIEVLGVERRKGQPADASIKRGSVFHEHFEGSSAVPFVDDGLLALRVWCKEDAGINDEAPIRYGLAVTIAAGTALPVYEEVQTRLRIRPRP
jgi:hypothetical protein